MSGADPVRTWMHRAIAMTHTRKIATTGIQCACLYSRRPTNAVIRNPAIGKMTRAGISDSRLIWSRLARRRAAPAVPRRAEVTATQRSLAHGVVFVDQRRLLVAVDGDHDRKADGGLRRGHGHDHERDDRPAGGC